jgi:hypothetical protein
MLARCASPHVVCHGTLLGESANCFASPYPGCAARPGALEGTSSFSRREHQAFREVRTRSRRVIEGDQDEMHMVRPAVDGYEPPAVMAADFSNARFHEAALMLGQYDQLTPEESQQLHIAVDSPYAAHCGNGSIVPFAGAELECRPRLTLQRASSAQAARELKGCAHFLAGSKPAPGGIADRSGTQSTQPRSHADAPGSRSR